MDTLSNVTGIKCEINPGTPLILTFAGMASQLFEFEHYEFVRTTQHADCSKIYCYDKNYTWYQSGVNDELNSLGKLTDKLKELSATAAPSNIRCLGVSAGGFASLFFGHHLKADVVHAFGTQTFLTRELEEQYYEEGMEAYDTGDGVRVKLDAVMSKQPNECFFDLEPVLRDWNGKTQYVVHVGKGSKKDVAAAKHIENCPGVQIKYYNCNTHACASQMLQHSGQLSGVVLENLHE
jgi:hypothetical protein